MTKSRLIKVVAVGVVSLTCIFGFAESAAASTTPVIPPQPTSTGTTNGPVNPGESRLYTVNPDGSKGKLVSPMVTDPAGCTLYPSVAYLRASYSYGAVGAKPYTKCDYPVTRISQQVQFYTVEWWGGSTAVGPVISGGNYNSASYTQFTTGFICVNRNSTTWWARTTGYVIVGGTTYYSEVGTSYKQLDCGRY